MFFPQPLAFVDLETTGASATKDRITEIGIVLVDEHGVREWSQLVHPQTRIPAFIEQMTGITNAMVANAPQFSEVAAEVDALLKGRLFIAHNARFDYGFLKNEFKRMGLTFQPSVLCTVKLSRKFYPEFRHHNLDSLIERHNLKAKRNGVGNTIIPLHLCAKPLGLLPITGIGLRIADRFRQSRGSHFFCGQRLASHSQWRLS